MPPRKKGTPSALYRALFGRNKLFGEAQLSTAAEKLHELGKELPPDRKQGVKAHLLTVISQWAVALVLACSALNAMADDVQHVSQVEQGIPPIDIAKVIALAIGAWEVVVRVVPTAKDYTIVSRILGVLATIFPNRVKGQAKGRWFGGKVWAPRE